jgi:hypothetical protein
MCVVGFTCSNVCGAYLDVTAGNGKNMGGGYVNFMNIDKTISVERLNKGQENVLKIPDSTTAIRFTSFGGSAYLYRINNYLNKHPDGTIKVNGIDFYNKGIWTNRLTMYGVYDSVIIYYIENDTFS